MENKLKTQQQIEQEMLELNEQFSEFLKTKGIAAKFKIAFNNMSESAKKQHEADVAEFEAIKAKSAEDNKEFAEFLCTKGIKAKYKLVVDNIKKGAKAARANTATQIEKVKAETQASIARANATHKIQTTSTDVTAVTLEDEFNAFLKFKGLDVKYTVSITENRLIN